MRAPSTLQCVTLVPPPPPTQKKSTSKKKKKMSLPASRLDLEAKLPLCDRRACACLTPPSNAMIQMCWLKIKKNVFIENQQ